jgi:rubrerythrin
MLKDQQIKTLMLACELEKSLADLYVLFGERHPDLKDLWALLIREEHGHAEAIRRLYQMTYEGRCSFDEGSIKPDAIQSIIDYVKETIEAARRGQFSAVRTVSIVYDLEKSLIEKDIFSHFRVSPAYAETLQLLQAQTMRHIELAKSALDQLKGGDETPAP